jgi:hypothetical protein
MMLTADTQISKAQTPPFFSRLMDNGNSLSSGAIALS